MERVYDLPWNFASPAFRAHARDAIEDILDHAPNEAEPVLAALNEGRIDGRSYAGPCACLLGTIAKARGCDFFEVHGYRDQDEDEDVVRHTVYGPDSPAERWFLGIQPGDTPENSVPARLAAEWIRKWIDAHTPAPDWVDAVDELVQAPDMVAV